MRPFPLGVLLASSVLAGLVPAQGRPPLVELRQPLPGDPWTQALALEDWDGDGDLDALRGSRPGTSAFTPVLPHEVQLLVNDGHGVFHVAERATMPGVDFAIGDLDGDDRVDALVCAGAAFADEHLGWLRNDGQGGFEALVLPVVFDSVVFSVHRIELADVDGDQDLDGVALSNAGLHLLRGDGAGGFALEALVSFGFYSELTSPALADLDGDGDADLAWGGPAGITLRFNDGGGGFTDELVLDPGLDRGMRAEWVVLDDVDGDDRADVLAHDPNLAGRLFLNRGPRDFVDASSRLPATFAAFALELVDVEPDGDLDLLTGPQLLLNGGDGAFRDAGERYPEVPYATVAGPGDLDGDRDVDLLLAGRDELVLLQDPRGVFRAFGRVIDGFSPQLADLDGDGDLDAVADVTEDYQTRSAWLANDGRGEFAVKEGALPGGLVADVDGDGDPDLLGRANGAVSLARNDGQGVFHVDPRPCGPLWPYYSDAAIGDLDGDGSLDLYLGRAGAGGCYEGCPQPALDVLWLGDGTGCFVDASASLPSFSGVTLGVALGDLELDGDLDVVTGAPQVLVNQGGASFLDGSAAIRSWVGYATDVALGDLDGDLLPDLYLPYGGSPGLDRLFPNDGLGGFGAPVSTPGFGLLVALGDLDGDGDRDVVERALVRTYLRGPVESFLQVLENDGAGAFTVAEVPRANPGPFALGDLDQDGDLDLFDGRRALFGSTRSLALRGWARIGRPFTLELAGAPGDPLFLIASPRLRRAPPSVLGVRQIDLSARVFGARGVLDAAGRLAFVLDVPSDPALIGTTLYWQALIGTPPRWSAFETTTFLSL